MMPTRPDYYREIDESLFVDLLSQLSSGKHIALFAHSGGGKGLIIHEIRRRARERGICAYSFDFRSFRRETVDELANEVAARLSVPEVQRRKGQRLSDYLFEVLSRATEKLGKPIWILVRDIMFTAREFARAFLEAVQRSGQDRNNAISALVAGSSDFLSMVHGANSPFRNAQQLLVTGLSATGLAAFVTSRRTGARIEGEFGDLSEGSHQWISDKALKYLGNQTNRNLHFVQEAMLASLRYPKLLSLWDPKRVWEVEDLKLMISTFCMNQMEIDFVVRRGMRVLQKNAKTLHMIRNLLRSNRNTAAKAPSYVTSLEVAGLVYRDVNDQFDLASPIWREFLGPRVSTVLVADTHAIAGNWEEAWKLYGEMPELPATRSATEDTEARLSPLNVSWIRETWNLGSGASQQERRKLLNHFKQGLNSFFGFDSFSVQGLPREYTASILGENPELTRHAQLEVDRSSKECVTQLSNERRYLQALYRRNLTYGPKCEIHLVARRSSPDAVLDEDAESVLKDSLQVFFESLDRSVNEFYKSKIGRFRKRALSTISALNAFLIHTSSDIDADIGGAITDTLVRSGLFIRAQLCMTSADGLSIQAVGSSAVEGEEPIAFPTNFRIDVNSQRLNSLDVQQWVAFKKTRKQIPDVHSIETNSPNVQADCESLGMKALLVLPLLIQNELLGTLHLERKDRRPFTNSEIEICEKLTEHVSTALRFLNDSFLIQGALHALEDEIRIADPDNLVIYRNPSSAAIDNANPGWDRTLMHSAIEKPTDSRSSVSKFVERQGGAGAITFDFRRAPIFDFRSKITGVFERADGFIGSVHRHSDLTELIRLQNSLSRWTEAETLSQLGEDIAVYFREAGFHWCRIYLLSHGGVTTAFKSIAQFGKLDTTTERNFARGKYEFPSSLISEDGVCGSAWLAKYSSDLPLHTKTLAFEEEGLQTFNVNDGDLRLDFKRVEKEVWLELPLILRGKAIGCVSLGLDARPTPSTLQLLSWAAVAAALSFESIKRRVKVVEAEVHLAWKKASAHASHQLQSRLLAPERILYCLSNEKDFSESYLKVANQSLTAAKLILTDLERYASDEPFTDWETLASSQCLEFVEVQLLGLLEAHRIANLPKFSWSPCIGSVNVSPSGLKEILEVMISNSCQHSGEKRSSLKIYVSCFVSDVTLPFRGGSKLCLAIAIEDSGVGLSKPFERVFGPGWSTKTSRGTGLGLSIAREFARKMGGDIVSGNGSNGANFTLYLPLTDDSYAGQTAKISTDN